MNGGSLYTDGEFIIAKSEADSIGTLLFNGGFIQTNLDRSNNSGRGFLRWTQRSGSDAHDRRKSGREGYFVVGQNRSGLER